MNSSVCVCLLCRNRRFNASNVWHTANTHYIVWHRETCGIICACGTLFFVCISEHWRSSPKCSPFWKNKMLSVIYNLWAGSGRAGISRIGCMGKSRLCLYRPFGFFLHCFNITDQFDLTWNETHSECEILWKLLIQFKTRIIFSIRPHCSVKTSSAVMSRERAHLWCEVFKSSGCFGSICYVYM